MTADDSEIDRIMADQSVVIARILEAVAQLGEIQTVVSRALVDLHAEEDKKMLFAFITTKAITRLNQATLIVFGEIARNERTEKQATGNQH